MAEDWEIVKIVGTEEEATVVVGFLQSSGIEAEVESLHASEFPTEVGDLATVRIRVPAERPRRRALCSTSGRTWRPATRGRWPARRSRSRPRRRRHHPAGIVPDPSQAKP